MVTRPETEIDSYAASLIMAFRELLLDVNTGLPAIIHSYDSDTEKATVQPVFLSVPKDETQAPFKKPLITDVPVLFPQSSQFKLKFPIQKGDAVWLLFSQRGLNTFKTRLKNFRNYTDNEQLDEQLIVSPNPEGFFSLQDAVVLPGFNLHDATAEDENDRATITIEGKRIRIDSNPYFVFPWIKAYNTDTSRMINVGSDYQIRNDEGTEWVTITDTTGKTLGPEPNEFTSTSERDDAASETDVDSVIIPENYTEYTTLEVAYGADNNRILRVSTTFLSEYTNSSDDIEEVNWNLSTRTLTPNNGTNHVVLFD